MRECGKKNKTGKEERSTCSKSGKRGRERERERIGKETASRSMKEGGRDDGGGGGGGRDEGGGGEGGMREGGGREG